MRRRPWPPGTALEHRRHTLVHGVATMGRARAVLTCPFCNADIRVFLWSLAGSGRWCDCGAKHGSMGRSSRPVQAVAAAAAHADAKAFEADRQAIAAGSGRELGCGDVDYGDDR